MDQKKLEEQIKELKGKIGFYYENMEDGTVLTYNLHGGKRYKASDVHVDIETCL